MNASDKQLMEHIDATLEYFELFKYPLLPEEIHRFLQIKCSYGDLLDQLNEMVKNKDVFLGEEGFYCSKDEPEWSIERKKGNKRAEELLYRSSRFVKVIKRFPFVISIAISGSLSKYYADEDADIDYFIITKSNRLWIARTLLHVYKKLTFIKGNEHFYCMNYFIDESAMEIDQKNIYSAIETVTLLPVYNNNLISKLKIDNSWITSYLPNESYKEDLRFLIKNGREPVKVFFEKVINVFGGSALNMFLMRITDRKWRKKWKGKSFPMDQYDEAFYTTPNISKNHPANYQSIVLNALKNKCSLPTQTL
jgi:hypothetical protein